jgi:hypothetical protein
MAAMVGKAAEIEPQRRRRGAERFSPDRLAARDEAAYRDCAARGRRRAVPATAGSAA